MAAAVHEVVGLRLNPLDRSLVLRVNERRHPQALARAQPGLPLKKGHCETMTHDGTRTGTTTLCAALSRLDGTVIVDRMPRHRHQERVRSLKQIDAEPPPELDLQFIVDSSGASYQWRGMEECSRHPGAMRSPMARGTCHTILSMVPHPVEPLLLARGSALPW